MFGVVKNFYREDLSEIDADGSDAEQLAEKVSLICTQKGWQTSAVGFCLRDDDDNKV